MILQGLMVVVLGLGFAADDNAEKIVGVWTTMEKNGKKEVTLTVEFTKDGKFKVSTSDGKDGGKKDPEITYKVEKGKLFIINKTPEGKESAQISTIKELTKDTLILIHTGKVTTKEPGKEPVVTEVSTEIRLKRK